MRGIFLTCSLLAGTLLFVSCASERTVTVKKAQPTEGLGKFTGNYHYAKDESGMMRSQSDQRSHYDNKVIQARGSQYGKSYSKKDYGRRGYSGERAFAAASYAGDVDGSRFQKSPWFVQQQAHVQGKSAHAQGKGYTTSQHHTDAAHETRGRRLDRPQDAETGVRRRVFKEPRIMTREEHAQLSVGDTKSMLGR